MTGPDGSSRYDAIRSLVLDDAALPDGERDVVAVLERLCVRLAAYVEVAGAAVCLVPGADTSGVVAASDHVARGRAEQELVTGEGPSRDAFATHRTVLVPDLGAASGRWPGYVSVATEAGVRAVFALPLQVGAASFGVLVVFAARAGSLGSRRLADALVFAQVATDLLLDARLTTTGGDLAPGLASALDHDVEVHQAQGMLMVSLGVSLTEAMVLMRSHAFSHSLPLREVARDIVAGRGWDGTT